MVCCPEQLTLGIDPGMIAIGGFKAVGMTVMTVMTFKPGSRWLVTSISASLQRAKWLQWWLIRWLHQIRRGRFTLSLS